MTNHNPNVVFILADDLGYGDLGCYGNRDLRTPHIDRLARQGIRCSQHYSASPLCAPARAALLTGRYNHRTGALSVESNRGLDRIALAEHTMADTFHAAGYRTGMVGKWHSGLFDMRYHPNARGFDEFAGFLNGGMGYYDWILDYNGSPKRSDGRYLTDVFTDEAIAFIDRHRTEPFFLFLSYNAPHSPLQAPDELVRHYAELGKVNPGVATLYAMIERMDTGIGRVMDRLDQMGLAQNTMVVFTSDNGPWLGSDTCNGRRYPMGRYNGPFRGMKQDVLEGGIRVPAIIRWPDGLPSGTECNAMLHFCDWFPTLAGAIGVTPTGLPVDGIDQLASLRGEAGVTNPRRFWQFNRYDPVLHCNMAMRDGDWKLYWPRIPEAMVKLRSDNEPYQRMFREPHREMPVQNPHVERSLSPAREPELYNIADDPRESKDVAAEFPDRVSKMRHDAETWFAEVEAERLTGS